MNSESLTIQLDLRRSRPLPGGDVVLVNRGTTDVRVWRTGNQWGDRVLSFEVLGNLRNWHFVRKPQEYTRNVPSSLVVPAGTHYRMSFDLGDESWEVTAPVDEVMRPGAKLIAVYDVPETPEAVRSNVWTGTLRSEPIQVD